MDKQTIEAFEILYGAHRPFEGADGVELYFETRGDGPPLTLLNNYFIVAPLWKNFSNRLAQRNRVLTYDLRNQGGSSPISGELRFPDHVEDLKALLDHLQIERTYLVGTSVSTLICRDFALAYPERVKGLVLVSPAFGPRGARRRKLVTKSWITSLDAGGPTALFDHLYPLVYSDETIEVGRTPAYLALRERFLAISSHAQIRTNLTASLASDDGAAKLERITCPTLLLTGDGDFLCSPSALTAMAELMPRARVELMPNTGHVPYFEDTETFERAVQAVIAEVELLDVEQP